MRDREPPNLSREQRREREYHDALAWRMDDRAMPPRERHPHESRFEDSILEVVGEVSGQRILDLGCGAGDLTLRLLKRGAEVTALDVSPGMVELTRRRVDRYLPEAIERLEVVWATAESTGLESGSYDWIVGKWVLHHVELEPVSAEIGRLLRPGGAAVFVETSALNPLLSFARRRLAGRAGILRYGTEDERPLRRRDLDFLGSRFASCRVDFPNFVFLAMLDRHLLRWRWPLVSRALRGLDSAIARVPGSARWSYYLRVRLEAEIT